VDEAEEAVNAEAEVRRQSRSEAYEGTLARCDGV
jgi:hypothetical protein